LDHSKIPKSVSKYDIVDIMTNSNQIVIQIRDVDTIPGTYPITITAIRPQGTMWQSESFTFNLNILAGVCADFLGSVVVTAPTIAEKVYTYQSVQGSVDVRPTVTATSCSESDVVYEMSIQSNPSGVASGFITFDSKTGLVSWFSQTILTAAIFTV
jgi:hypothetical protein